MKFVAYYRVSTKHQGRSGLGLEAQKGAVTNYIESTGDKLIASFQEIESGTDNDRPELKAALAIAKSKGAKLIVAKLDRLGRKASYILRLIDESGVEFHICDMPDADKLTITILAAVAEREAENTSKRTKAALAVRKAQGVKVEVFAAAASPYENGEWVGLETKSQIGSNRTQKESHNYRSNRNYPL